MIKTLIVDDDFLVRMFLKQLIDWESQGFTLVGDACGGEEALSDIDGHTLCQSCMKKIAAANASK